MKILRKHLKRILLLIGIAAFTYLVWELGWESTVDSLLKMRWWWLGIFVLACTWQMCHTLAWSQILKALGHRPSAWFLFRLKFISEAINMVAPSANIGGDMVRAYLIGKEVPLTTGISSVLIDKTIDNFSRMFFNMVGLLVTAILLPVPQEWIKLAAGLFAVVFLLNVLSVVFQVRGLGKSVNKLAGFLPFLRSKVARRRQQLASVETELQTVYLRSPLHVVAAIGWNLMARTLGLMEVWLILWLLGTGIGLEGAYYVAAVVNVINSAFFMVPGQWGVAEGTQVLLLQSLGFTAAVGLSLGVIRRIRRLVLTGVGLLLLAKYRQADNTLLENMPAEVPEELSTPLPE